MHPSNSSDPIDIKEFYNKFLQIHLELNKVSAAFNPEKNQAMQCFQDERYADSLGSSFMLIFSLAISKIYFKIVWR